MLRVYGRNQLCVAEVHSQGSAPDLTRIKLKARRALVLTLHSEQTLVLRIWLARRCDRSLLPCSCARIVLKSY